MLIPLRTDAPVHHRPWATGGIIAANVAVHVWTLGADVAAVEPLILHYGQWAPRQWLTSVFLHAGWFHLIGNMLFLWVFGLVVEGKIGALRFLALYAAIAVASGLFEQTVMLGADGGSLGASGVIYGLIAVSMVWAPDNDVDCLFIWFPVVREIELSIKALAGWYLATQIFGALFHGLCGLGLGSAALHLIGAAAGLPLGLLMLERGWVDCEGWDWFSRRDRVVAPIRVASRPRTTPPAPRVAAARAETPATSWGVDAGLAEARRLLSQRRPSKADGVLAAVAGRLEDDEQRRVHRGLVAQAQALRDEGVLEFDD